MGFLGGGNSYAESWSGELSGFSGLLKNVRDMFRDIESSSKGTKNNLQGMKANLSGGVNGGQIGNGNANISMLGNSLGGFTNNGAMNSAILNQNILSSAVKMGGTAVAGAFASMPNVAGTVAQATASYNALTMSGMNTSMAANTSMQNWMQNQMGKTGQTSIGSAANTAAIFANMGMGFDPTNGNYISSVNTVAGLSKMLGVSNESAAMSVATMQGGDMSSRLLNRFGILTTDPNTSKQMTMPQIFNTLISRFSTGKGMDAANIQRSFLGGGFKQLAQSAGFDATTTAAFEKFALEKAKGTYLDLADPNLMNRLTKDNPQNAINQMNASNSAAQTSVQDTYLKGIQDAANALDGLNKAASNLANTLGAGRLNAMTQTLAGTTAGGAAIGTAASLGGQALGVGSNLLNYAAANKIISAGGGKTIPAGKSLARGARNVLGKGVGVLAKGAAGDLAGSLGSAGAAALGASTAGQFWAGMGTAFGVSELIGGAETFGVSGLIGAGGYALTHLDQISQMLGGKGGTGGTGGKTDTTAGQGGALTMVPPASGAITATFGETGPMWNGSHHGIDYGVKVGSNVIAAAGGKVSYGDNAILGMHMYVDHGGGYKTLYAHLSQRLARIGDEVSKGQLIAKSGASGKVTGAHLHFGVLKNGTPVNPASFVPVTGISKLAQDAKDFASSVFQGSVSGAMTSASAMAEDLLMPLASLLGVGDSFMSMFGGSGGGSNPSGNTAMGIKQPSSNDKYLTQAGFKGQGLAMAHAIMMAESGGKATAHNGNAKTGDNSYGLFQINMLGAMGPQRLKRYHLSNNDALYDPLTNAKVAYDMSHNGADWGAWSTYKSGAYKQYLTGAPGASKGISYVAQDMPVNVHQGEAILPANEAREYREDKLLGGGKGANVTIHVTLHNSSDAEAMRLVNLVKKQLQHDKLTSTMGTA